MTLGSKIRELRMAKGLTQSDLGSGLVTPSMISQIESDKANPSYKVLEAIAAKLEQPMEYFLSDVQTQLEQGTAYKVAKALMASKSFDRAVEVLEKVLEKPATNLNLIEVKIDRAKCLLELSQYDEAHDSLKEAVETATSKSEYYLAISALTLLGRLELLRKKHYNAIYYWRKGYDLFPLLDNPDPFLQGNLLNDLGSIHCDLGETHDALKYQQEALMLLSDTSNFEQIGKTYLGLALSFRQADQLERASEFASYAEALFQSTANVKLAIEVKRNFATSLHNGKGFSKTLTYLEECLQQCKTLNFTEQAASIYRDIAWLHIQQNQPELSLEATEEGLAIATEGSLTAANLLRVRGLALGNLDRQGEVVQCLEEAINTYRSHDQKADLADCYTLLAELHQTAGDVLTANKCLQQMRQVMQESLRERGLIFSA